MCFVKWGLNADVKCKLELAGAVALLPWAAVTCSEARDVSGWVRLAVPEWPGGFITSWKPSWLIQTLYRTFTARNLWNLDPFYNPCASFFLKALIGTIALRMPVAKWLFPWWGHTGTGNSISPWAFPGCFLVPAGIFVGFFHQDQFLEGVHRVVAQTAGWPSRRSRISGGKAAGIASAGLLVWSRAWGQRQEQHQGWAPT